MSGAVGSAVYTACRIAPCHEIGYALRRPRAHAPGRTTRPTRLTRLTRRTRRRRAMELREALYTTRAMRRITDEPIPTEVRARILDAAVRAPSAGNTQGWRFLLVDDPDVKARLGALYRECMDQHGRAFYADRRARRSAPRGSREPAPPAGDALVRLSGPRTSNAICCSSASARATSTRSSRRSGTRCSRRAAKASGAA